MIGSVVGSYRIVRQIGEGGMGRVYLAEHELIGKRAAVKVLLQQYSANVDVVNRFFNEARASSVLKHPGVIDIYDFGKLTDGSAYIIMEFLDGESLGARLQRERRLGSEIALDITRQVAGALAAAHSRGIVHRDLKPDNIFLLPDTEMRLGFRVKILDFGIAKLTDVDQPQSYATTRTGAIIGTPTYMSPEQCRGAGRVDHRTDVYALGCVLCEMVLGRPPFVGEGPGDVIAAHMFQEPPSLTGMLPTPYDQMVAQMLAKTPQDRVQSMGDVLTMLNQPAPRASALATVRMAVPVDESAPAQRPRKATPLPTAMHPHATVYAAPRTTLGAATGEVSGPVAKGSSGAGRRIAIVAVTAVVVIGAVGAAIVRTRARTGAPDNEPTAAVAAPVAAPVVEQTQPAPPPQPARAPEPAVVHLSITSQPNGADVYRTGDGARVGKTPWVLQLSPSNGQATYTLKLRGYRDGQTTIDLDRDGARSVSLEKIHHGSAPTRPVEKKPTKNGVVDPFDN